MGIADALIVPYIPKIPPGCCPLRPCPIAEVFPSWQYKQAVLIASLEISRV